MDVTTDRKVTLVQIFNDDDVAQVAVRELKKCGISESQIRVVSHDAQPSVEVAYAESGLAKGGKVGAATGAGIGAICSFAVLAGISPEMSPLSISTLEVLLAFVFTGAMTIGTMGALIGFGMWQENAAHSHDQNSVHHTIVTVRAGNRSAIASSVLDRLNRSDTVIPIQAS